MSDLQSTKGILYTDGTSGELKVRRYVLKVTKGPNLGLEKNLESGTVLIGTHPNNDLVLTDATVSRYHLEIQVRADGIRVSDLDSTNGTYLNETRLGSVVVRARARFRVGGETELEILPADEAIKLAPFGKNYFGKVYGASPAMTELFALLNQVAPTESTVLLQGETGTGKELIAEAVHATSLRADGPFVVVDCGALPRELMAAELFGHTRGAFTGANQAKRGLVDEANGGTLFLDEIGELPLDLQPQLLRVLEKREIRPIGETRTHKVDVRVVAATNRDLRTLVHSGQFREDLYFRLAVVHVVVPPLRKRIEDIPELARLFLEQIGKGDFFVPEAIILQLQGHDWPGNVRELRNVVERGMSLATAQLNASEEEPLQQDPTGPDRAMTPEMMDLPFKEAKGLLVEAFEKEYLTHLLERHHGNISRAAAEAGIDRNYIHRLVKKYGIPVQRS
jgi:DNA-binding NtrC family response regulator